MANLEKGPEDLRPPRPEVLREKVRFLAADSANVTITCHAEERMVQRDITSTMMFKVLRSGMLSGEVQNGKRVGDWVVKVTGSVPGKRDVGVVTAVLARDRLVIITVQWEDMR
ncbi:hypothetical protein BYZ73_06500 [Rhodovulum viride]|uniref:DUF4258 domain-containing protein n=1 Tax=Rhodovulum viride TaxID=1231134 RepID=A0ABX9DL55_9RHOB|nr:DUF4258 domain-containing protein [Rhodovulum viride]RAP42003.1 hypothetical protein BYZ73_06500 [Rhodovulum viride]